MEVSVMEQYIHDFAQLLGFELGGELARRRNREWAGDCSFTEQVNRQRKQLFAKHECQPLFIVAQFGVTGRADHVRAKDSLDVGRVDPKYIVASRVEQEVAPKYLNVVGDTDAEPVDDRFGGALTPTNV
jgi:hypothetical protein